MSQQPVIAFIGAGNMARAIIGGLLKTVLPPQTSGLPSRMRAACRTWQSKG